jgi:ribosomal protein S10
MIKTITPGTGINVHNNSSWPSFYNTTSNNSLVGQIRYNGQNQNMEVYDGNSWMLLTSGYPTIELAPHVQEVVAWAQVKMAEEKRLRELADQHPSVADALAALDRAQEQVQVVAALVQE